MTKLCLTIRMAIPDGAAFPHHPVCHPGCRAGWPARMAKLGPTIRPPRPDDENFARPLGVRVRLISPAIRAAWNSLSTTRAMSSGNEKYAYLALGAAAGAVAAAAVSSRWFRDDLMKENSGAEMSDSPKRESKEEARVTLHNKVMANGDSSSPQQPPQSPQQAVRRPLKCSGDLDEFLRKIPKTDLHVPPATQLIGH